MTERIRYYMRRVKVIRQEVVNWNQCHWSAPKRFRKMLRGRMIFHYLCPDEKACAKLPIEEKRFIVRETDRIIARIMG